MQQLAAQEEFSKRDAEGVIDPTAEIQNTLGKFFEVSELL